VVTELLQCCYSVVTVLLQCCYSTTGRSKSGDDIVCGPGDDIATGMGDGVPAQSTSIKLVDRGSARVKEKVDPTPGALCNSVCACVVCVCVCA
jgi:hypothetical protein